MYVGVAMIDEFLNSLNPESEGLLREISKHISDEMLEWISRADYGEDAEKHLVALRQIRDTGTFPAKMYWYPGEVLELSRWSPLEELHPDVGWATEVDHWMRAFCCAALLRATREPYNYGDGISTDDSIVRLILSLNALPVDLVATAAKFLAWLLLSSEPEGNDEQVCAYGLGLLWFALARRPHVPDGGIGMLLEWIERRVQELYPGMLMGNQLPLRMGVGNPPPSLWGLLGVMLGDLDLNERSEEIQATVKIFAERLAE